MKNKGADQLLASIFAKQARGRIFVISGPSGVGKTAASQAVLQRLPRMVYSVSYTTRPRRPRETDGKDYFFISEKKFRAMIEEKQFLEWARVHGNLYGTSRKKTYQEIDSGHSIILDIDVQGAEQIRKKEKHSSLIFLLPPSMEVLYTRLIKRNSDSVQEIGNRIEMAYNEIEQYSQYDYLVINNEFDKLVDQLEGIIKAELCRVT